MTRKYNRKKKQNGYIKKMQSTMVQSLKPQIITKTYVKLLRKASLQLMCANFGWGLVIMHKLLSAPPK
jgi:hypothetical protein